MRIIIFTRTSPPCGFCQMAKLYLAEHNIPYTETIYNDPTALGAMFDANGLSGSDRTVPQIFLVEADGRRTRIGGYRDLRQSDIAARMAKNEAV